jgi:hypothetical protein
MGARMKREEETAHRVIKLSIREKRGAERLTTHPHDLFLGYIIAGRKRRLSKNTEKPERTIDFPVFQGDLLQYVCLTSSSHQTTPNMMGRPN